MEHRQIIAELYELLQDPISLEIMSDPVVTSAGTTYERGPLMRALRDQALDPQTREPVQRAVVPNRLVRSIVERFAHEFEELAAGSESAPRPVPALAPWLQRLRLQREPLDQLLKATLRSAQRNAARAADALIALVNQHPPMALVTAVVSGAWFAASVGVGVGMGAALVRPLGAFVAGLPHSLGHRALPVGLAPFLGALTGMLAAHSPARAEHYVQGMDAAVLELHIVNLAVGVGRACSAHSARAAGAAILGNAGAYLLDDALAAVARQLAPLAARPVLSQLREHALAFALVGVLAGLSRLA